MSIQQTFNDVDIDVDVDVTISEREDNTVTAPKEDWYREETGEKKCHGCGEWYTARGLGQHWGGSDCNYPEPTERQMEIMEGMMLGDGCVAKDRLLFKTKMTNKTFIEWLANELGYLWTQNTTDYSGSVMSGGGVAQDSNCLDCYKVCTHSNILQIKQMRSWYQNAEERKIYPDDLELTPLVLKMWFISDWTYDDYGSHHVKIHKDKFDNWTEMLLQSWFDEFGWEYNRKEIERSDGTMKGTFVFTKDSTHEIFDYMGDPVPGFEYKWPDGPSYEEAKQRHCTVNGDPYYPGIFEDQESEM